MENLKRIAWIAAGIIAGATLISKTKEIINHIDNKNAEKEHQIILKTLIESDERIKKLLELEEIKQLGAKFKKHPKSDKFCNLAKRKIWAWNTGITKNILIPLDKGNSIIPRSRNVRLFILAHEFGHIITQQFSPGNCVYNINDCLSKELQAHVAGAWLLLKINVRFKKSFWRNQLIRKWHQCEECLGVIGKGKCPKTERKKIKKSLYEIARSVKE